VHRCVLTLTILLLLCIGIGPTEARVFFTGSNPNLTVFAFPQDILLMPGEMVFYYGGYQVFPWWGDIDEPDNKPSKKYALTGEKTDEWSHDQSINQFDNMVGFTRYLSDSSKLRFDFDYLSSHLNADAEYPDYTYHERHAIRDFYLNSMLATHYKGIPIGMKVGLGVEMTSKPDLEHFLANGQRSSLFLWGWDGEQSYTQDNFNLGNLFRFDAQMAATFPRYKIGGRFRLYHGTLDKYRWNNDSSRYTITPNKINNLTGRVYGIYNWFEREKFKFNTTILTRYTYVDSIQVIPGNTSIETGDVQKAKTFVFQINPNVNIYPWPYPMTYIDAAILCNYSHTNYDHVGNWYVGGGMQEGYINSGIWSEEDYSWENFSYARENFFELALDVNAAVPVIGMKDQSVSLGITMFIWRRYKWFDKFFGKTDVLSNDLAFSIEKIRQNLDKETWLNSIINIFYRRGKYLFRLDIGQPLIYSQLPRTRITDGTGDHIIYEKTRENMWLSQSGMKVGFFVSTSLENFRSYRLWRTFDKEK
jgi:hypothetical protein